jgi:thiol-disulfide isomerase/thioredoxin
MRTSLVCLVLGLLLAPPLASAPATEALCPVCRVMEGATELEEVKAHATYHGTDYGFCSKKCKQEFEKDPGAFLPPVIPRPAPAATVTDEKGTVVTLPGAFAGKVVLVDFWASWCQPCLTAMPELVALQAKYGERGFTVVGVSIDDAEPTRKKAAELARSKGLTYPVLYDTAPEAAFDAYRVKVIPAAYLLDAQGQIVAQWSGKVDLAAVDAAVRGQIASRTGD